MNINQKTFTYKMVLGWPYFPDDMVIRLKKYGMQNSLTLEYCNEVDKGYSLKFEFSGDEDKINSLIELSKNEENLMAELVGL